MFTLHYEGEPFHITVDYVKEGLSMDNDKFLSLVRGCRILHDQYPFTSIKWKQKVVNPNHYKFDIVFHDLVVHGQVFEIITGQPLVLVSQSTDPIKMSSLGQIRVLRDLILRFQEDYGVTKLDVISHL